MNTCQHTRIPRDARAAGLSRLATRLCCRPYLRENPAVEVYLPETGAVCLVGGVVGGRPYVDPS